MSSSLAQVTASQVVDTQVRWPIVVALAVGARILLLPITHTWDSQTWFNIIIELARFDSILDAVRSPYETMRDLSLLSRSQRLGLYYEYWAYPPLLLYVYYLLVKLVSHLGVDVLTDAVFNSPETLAWSVMPLPLLVAVKLPAIVADLGIAASLARLGGVPAAARSYLLNPYVLLMSAWMFDSVMVLCLLIGVFLAERRRMFWAGVAIGLGASTKLVPVLALPAIVLWALRSLPAPMAPVARLGAGFVMAFALLCWPVADGLAYVLQFHAERRGGGLTWQGAWLGATWWLPDFDWQPILISVSPSVGTAALGLTLLLALTIGWVRALNVRTYTLILLLAYLIGAKLVNEVYALPVVCLALLESTHRGGASRLVAARLLWLIPLLYAAVNVPVWGFFIPVADALGLVTPDEVKALHEIRMLIIGQTWILLAVLGLAFTMLCVASIAIFSQGAPDDYTASHRAGDVLTHHGRGSLARLYGRPHDFPE